MIVITGVLTTTGALAISTGRASAASDRPVLRDTAGRPLIPGSSLAGALRAACRRRYGDRTADEVFGPSQITRESPSRRSALRVEAARYLGDDVPSVKLRQHVAIDRERLAAAPGLKFDAQSWPRGLRFGLQLMCPRSDLPVVLGTLEALCSPGSGVGSGPCPVEITELNAHLRAPTAALVQAAGRRYEQPDLPAPHGPAVELPDPAPPRTDNRTFCLDLVLRTATPLACREPLDPFTSDRDNEPFTVVAYDKHGTPRRHPAIPGSSMLGVLRQRAERALAVAGIDPGDPTRPDGVDVDSHIGRTFGAPGSDRDDALAGAVHVDDLLADDVDWTDDDPTAHRGRLARVRVKIDRLTHSTLGSNLFDDTLLAEGVELRGRVVIAPPDRPADDHDLLLIAFGLRDLANGLVGVGGSSRSGYGTVEIAKAMLTEHHAEAGAAVETCTELLAEDGRFSWGEQLEDRLADAWEQMTASAVVNGELDG